VAYPEREGHGNGIIVYSVDYKRDNDIDTTPLFRVVAFLNKAFYDDYPCFDGFEQDNCEEVRE